MTSSPRINVAIIGLGLLGASLGMALRGVPAYRRFAWTRRPEIRRWALENDVADSTADSIEDILKQADITILCLPIPCDIDYLERYASVWRPGSIVTDIGSVKGVILDAADRFLLPCHVRFVGSHPMAGTEKSGPYNAFPTLYRNADVFLCPSRSSDPDALTRVADLWRAVNMKPVQLDSAQDHDRLVAHTSHVLHVVASALALGILDGGSPQEQALRFSGCATGFRDTSRIASSNPAMWREIIENNTPAVLEALDHFSDALSDLRNHIARGDYDRFESEFARGKRMRDEWLRYKSFPK